MLRPDVMSSEMHDNCLLFFELHFTNDKSKNSTDAISSGIIVFFNMSLAKIRRLARVLVETLTDTWIAEYLARQTDIRRWNGIKDSLVRRACVGSYTHHYTRRIVKFNCHYQRGEQST